jgi:hypothetical protein
MKLLDESLVEHNINDGSVAVLLLKTTSPHLLPFHAPYLSCSVPSTIQEFVKIFNLAQVKSSRRSHACRCFFKLHYSSQNKNNNILSKWISLMKFLFLTMYVKCILWFIHIIHKYKYVYLLWFPEKYVLDLIFG